MLQVDSNSPSQTNTLPNAGVVPVSNQAFGNALRGLKEQKFSVICNIFENNEDGLRELLSNPIPPVEALVARFGELEAEVVSKRLIDLIDTHSAKTQGVDRGDISSFTAQLQSKLGSVLKGFGMDTQRPPYIDKAFAKSVEKAISKYSSDPESQALIGLLQREAQNFFAARDVVDFRAIGLGKVEGALRALGEESGRASEVQDRSDQPSFNGSGRPTIRETPEALRFVRQAGVRSLRADVGFDSIADLRKADDCVIDAVVKLETLTQNLEIASYLVNRMLQFPPELFEVMKDTRNGLSAAEFEIEAVQETVDLMVSILRQSLGNTENNLKKWRQTDPFQQLPRWYQEALENEVANDRSTSASAEFVLKNQLEADRMGLGAEQRAEDILNDLVKEGTINRFSKSIKHSDADRMGLDYAIWLPDGNVIYLDIKSSATGAYHADSKRIEFAEKVQMNPSLSFIGLHEEPKIIFLRSTLVIISPDSRDEINKNRMVEAISKATTLPDELRPTDVTEAIRPWQSTRVIDW